MPQESLAREAYMSGRLGNERASMLRQSGEDINKGTQEVAKGLGSLGKAVTQHAANQEITNGALGLAQTIDQLDRHYNEAASSPEAQTDPNFTENWRQSVMNPALNAFRGQFNTPEGQRWAAEHTAAAATELYRHTTAMDMNRAADQAEAAITQTTNTLASMAHRSPAMTDMALGMIPGTVDAIAQNANLSPQAVDKLRTTLQQTMHREIAAAGIKGAIENISPEAGQQMLNSGKYDQYLAPADTEALGTHVGTMARVNIAQARADEAETRRQQKEAFDQGMSQTVASIITPSGQLAIPQNFFTNLGKAAGMPEANPETLKSAIAFGKSLSADASLGKNDVTNDVIGADFNTRAFLPPDDPKALTYKEIFDAKTAHELSNSDTARLFSAIMNNKRSDLNQQMDSGMVHQALQEAQLQLGAGSLAPTAPGMRAYSQLMQWFTPAYQEAVRRGISPAEAVEKLLTPERIDSFKAGPIPNAGSGWTAPNAAAIPSKGSQRSLADIFGSELK